MFEASIIEFTIATLLRSLGKRLEISPEKRAPVDFIYSDDDGKTIAIEVKGALADVDRIRNIFDRALAVTKIDKFILITPDSPSIVDLKKFNDASRGINAEIEWLGFQAFTKKLSGISVSTSQDISKLRNKAFTKSMGRYEANKIGHPPMMGNPKGTDLLKKVKNNKQEIEDLQYLSRQFHLPVITDFKNSQKEISEYFSIGKEYRDAIIVKSDLINFSSIVSSAHRDDLNETMRKYYREAKESVFRYNGMLDKFIGDAVLAIFNYPKQRDDAVLSAFQFSIALISSGKRLMGELLSNMDQQIKSGTRIGISTGEIYPLDIGEGMLEVSFVGNSINLAARLESQCIDDGILFNNKTYANLRKSNGDFVKSLEPVRYVGSPEELKGQKDDIIVWQVGSATVSELAAQSSLRGPTS